MSLVPDGGSKYSSGCAASPGSGAYTDAVVKIADATLERLAFPRIREALAERASTYRGRERALALVPLAEAGAIEQALSRVEEVVGGGALSLGGVSDIRPLLQQVAEGRLLEGTEILEIAYTMDAANTIRRSILASERPALGAVAARLGSFDGVLRLVREQLDTDGKVRDNATPRLGGLRRRRNPLEGGFEIGCRDFWLATAPMSRTQLSPCVATAM